jgi:hypothetical protein
MAKPFSVDHWGSHPDEENDDCYTGEDFDDLFLALQAYFTDPSDRSVAYVEIDGLEDSDLRRLGIPRARKNPRFVPSPPSSNGEWQREQAMQAGMAFGVDGYNDIMGY